MRSCQIEGRETGAARDDTQTLYVSVLPVLVKYNEQQVAAELGMQIWIVQIKLLLHNPPIQLLLDSGYVYVSLFLGVCECVCVCVCFFSRLNE